MDWIEINDAGAVSTLLSKSIDKPEKVFVVFKHSTRCGTSRMARILFESEWTISEPVYLINVVESRAASDAIESILGVIHESPQAVAIRNGKCVYHNSHAGINAPDFLNLVSSNQTS